MVGNMQVYRMVKSRARTQDLSGTGAFNAGGRWNMEGVYAVYTSAHRSLALLENLVHLDEDELPDNLFIITIEIADNVDILTLEPETLPDDWRQWDNLFIRQMGTDLLKSKQYLVLKVPSAIMPFEYNYILNPLYPGFEQQIKIAQVDMYETDARLRYTNNAQ